MEVRDYLQKVRKVVFPFFIKKEEVVTTHACCLYISEKDISILHINATQEGYDVVLSEVIRYDNDIESLTLVLASFVKRNELLRIPTTWLIEPEDYQLFLIESMPVHPDEFREALNWRLRSLVNYPIEDAVVDYFMMPPKKVTPQQPMIAAVVARQVQLRKNFNLLTKAGFNIDKIDVPEIALRNLTALLENDEKSNAFLYFFDKVAILNITREKTIYFTRRLNLPGDFNNKKNIEDLSLDILRYFDYFQSQWRFPSPTRIFLGSGDKFDANELVKMFSEYLLSKTEIFPINKFLHTPDASKLQKNCLLSFGSLITGN